ncbi:MAG TPA: hypothetical protein DCP69_10140 [Candidatus Omnitrophica bacterium]|nr:hypothetical protein [Candidatus Omnitrophota bacterium]
MNYDGLALAKPRPRALERADKAKELAKLDRAENAKVKARSGGRCEVNEAMYDVTFRGKTFTLPVLCGRRANDIHHLKGGNGRRNRGESIKAAWKLHVCRRCHELITRHVLVPVDPQADAASIVYRRRT